MREEDVQEVVKMCQRLYKLRVYSELNEVDKFLFTEKPMPYKEWVKHVAESLQAIESILNTNKDMLNMMAWES